MFDEKKKIKTLQGIFLFVGDQQRCALERQLNPTRNFDEISVRESLLVLRLSDNALAKSDSFPFNLNIN